MKSKLQRKNDAQTVRKYVAQGLKLLEVKGKGSAEYFTYHTKTLKLNATAADKRLKVAKRFAHRLDELLALGLNWTMLTTLAQYNIPDEAVNAVIDAIATGVLPATVPDFITVLYGGEPTGDRAHTRKFDLETFYRALREYAHNREHAQGLKRLLEETPVEPKPVLLDNAITKDDVNSLVASAFNAVRPPTFVQEVRTNGTQGAVDTLLVSLRERLEVVERKYLTALVREEEQRIDVADLLELMREFYQCAQEVSVTIELYQAEHGRLERLVPYVIAHLERMIAAPQTSVEVEITPVTINREAFLRP